MERHQTEQAPDQAPLLSEPEKNRYRDLLLTVVGTEFAQPLNLIQMNREYLALHLSRSGDDSPAVQQALADMDLAALRMTRLLNNCMDLLACLTDDAAPQWVPLDLGAVLQSLIRETEGLSQIYPAQIQSDCPLDTLCVMADRAMAERVFLNLLSNALRACSGGGHIRITLRGGPAGGEILFADDGCGVSADFAARAFAPNGAAGRSRRDGFAGGAGVGLCLAGMYCRLLGWQPEMQPLAKGTRVRLAIPADRIAPDRRLVFRSGESEWMQAHRRQAVLLELRTVPGLENLGRKDGRP